MLGHQAFITRRSINIAKFVGEIWDIRFNLLFHNKQIHKNKKEKLQITSIIQHEYSYLVLMQELLNSGSANTKLNPIKQCTKPKMYELILYFFENSHFDLNMFQTF